MKTFVLIPHFDDEVFVVAALSLNAKLFKNPIFIFLTADDGRRVLESKKFLSSFNYSESNYIFLGQQLGIFDGNVVSRINDISNYIQTLCDSSNMILLAPAWEGGHPDHDAAFLAAHLLASKQNTEVFEYPTYNGFNTISLFFKIMSPINNIKITYKEKIPALLYFKIILNVFTYQSQWKTWIGFLPGLILKAFWNRNIVLTSTKDWHPLHPPHTGILLYERYNRTTFKEFAETVKRQLTNQ